MRIPYITENMKGRKYIVKFVIYYWDIYDVYA